jgi:asparagine synthase (glutamine-hydrolysing)
MCGLAGIVCDNAKNYAETMRVMLDRIQHRGPDDSGIAVTKNCVLGHVRLSIVDLSGGKQPMQSTFSDNTIVFNGEIYGFKNIRNDLSGTYKFQTVSDTEVLLALNEKYGSGCVEKHDGMFAYAIWSESKRTLFAARDRFGEKPFFYALLSNGGLIFASEIKAILASGLIDPQIDTESVNHYLKFMYVHPHKTIYKNIHVLPPAHKLEYADGKLTIKKYWELPVNQQRISLGDAIAEFKTLFNNAIADQLISDVPVGAFLSGGLDSSTVVAVAGTQKKKLQTFSFGFQDSQSELPFALEIANKYETDHKILQAADVDISELILKMPHIYDEPFADSSNIPTYLIAKLAREHVKVVLTGDGADELLGGYTGWYSPLVKSRSVNAILKQIIKSIIRNRRFTVHDNGQNISEKELSLRASVIDQYRLKSTAFKTDELYELTKDPAIVHLQYDCSNFKSVNSINDALNADLTNYMPGDILTKIDRASMANSLELRAPFLDVKLSSFLISLPSSLKVTNTNDKILLRNTFAEMWTENIRKRKKQGFGALVENWFCDKRVAELTDAYLLNRNLQIYSYFDNSAISKYRNFNDYRTWILLTFSIWLQNR